MKKNLTLTGMMGVGKSTIGRALSKRLLKEFVDIDKIIENKLSLPVQKIFDQKGEPFFRKLEEKVTLEEIKKDNKIISLGGGAFMSSKIRKYVTLHTKSFWLDINTNILAKRLQGSKKRPLLVGENIKFTLEKIFNERKNTYSLANFKIDCNDLTTVSIVNKIIQLYEND